MIIIPIIFGALIVWAFAGLIIEALRVLKELKLDETRNENLRNLLRDVEKDS